ncbi:MAG: hypothetical protein RM338_24370 [Nostoc sp. DedQUE12a]|nr:hypothetical protein [Nostoc sp. DedQUE12a]
MQNLSSIELTLSLLVNRYENGKFSSLTWCRIHIKSAAMFFYDNLMGDRC